MLWDHLLLGMDPFQIYFVSLAHLSIIRTGTRTLGRSALAYPNRTVVSKVACPPLNRWSARAAAARALRSSRCRCTGAVDRLRVSPSMPFCAPCLHGTDRARCAVGDRSQALTLRFRAALDGPHCTLRRAAAVEARGRHRDAVPAVPQGLRRGAALHRFPCTVNSPCGRGPRACPAPVVEAVDQTGALHWGAGRERHRTRADVRCAHAAHAPAADVPGGVGPPQQCALRYPALGRIGPPAACGAQRAAFDGVGA